MGNKFNITITATDNATKVVNKVNKSVGSIFRPYDNAKKSLKSFTDAVGRNDLVRRPLWALDKIGSGVTAFGNAFGVAENSVIGGSARLAASLGAIGGPIGGFLAGAAAIVGGTAAVSVKMGQLGFDVARTAKNLNMTTTQLQEYRGAAKQAGLQSEAMDASLLSLGTTLQDADFGRNPLAAETLKRMGVTLQRTKDGAVDTGKAFRDISDVVSHMTDQNNARKLTDILGVTEMLPLLREGTLKLDEYIATAHKVGSVMSDDVIEKNKKQAESWNQTKTAVEGAAISIGNVIAKYLDLNNAAAAATSAAERLQKEGPSWRMLAENIWNHAPPAWLFRKMFGEMGTSGQGGQGPQGSWGGGAQGSWGPAATGGQAQQGGNLPIGLRQNNPGNLRSWPGAEKVGGFAAFGTPEAGIGAMAKNLMAYQDKYGINTVSKIINRWAPASDGNNVPAYMASVSKSTGFGLDQPLDLHNPQVLAPLISAITKHENGQNPYSTETITQAVTAAVRDSGGGGDKPINLVVHNVPAGMTVKAARGLGQSAVGLTMAPGGTS